MPRRQANRPLLYLCLLVALGPLLGTETQAQYTLPALPPAGPDVGPIATQPACPQPNICTSLTLADLETVALTYNPTIPAAAAAVVQQEGLLKQAWLYPNPTGGYVRSDPDQLDQSKTVGVFLSQDIVTAGKILLAAAAARREVEHSNWHLEAQRSRVLNDARIRFYEVLGAQQALQAAQELEGLAEEGVKIAERLLQAKRGSRPDVLQAELQLSAVRTSVQDARYRHEAAWRQLAHIVGVQGLTPVPLIGSLECDIPDLDFQKLLQELQDASPLVRAQQAEIEASRIEVTLAKAQAFPNVSFQMVLQRDSVMKFTSVNTLIAMPIPLFNRNQGNILNAQGRLQQQQKELERIQLALADELAVSFRQYLTLRSQADRLQKEVLPKARENLELTTEGYKAGTFDFQRELTARQTYFHARLAVIDALTELHKVLIEIKGLQLTGGLNPTEVGAALQMQGGAGPAGARNVLLQQLQEQRGGGSRTLPGAIQAGER
jgi:cobalt-zinc-cadmium efflux system outer membrane protein